MAEMITSDAVVPGPGRASRLGIAVGPARPRAIPHVRAANRASRSSAGGCRRAQRGPRCRRRSSRHGRRAGQMDQWSSRSTPRRRGRWRTRATGWTHRCRPPSTPRSARKPAPPRRSGRSEGISATAGASANPSPSTWPANHAQSQESRLGSRQTDVERGEIRIHAGGPTPLPGTPAARKIIARKWRNPNHFANCLNFEQSLLKLMTRRKRWSTTAGSGRP